MKLAIIGTGKIVHSALRALPDVPQIEVRAIYARPQSRDKGEAIAREHHIPEVYTDYARLLRESDADFIYVANINLVHYDYARQALLAGKHVIVEKPMCVNASQTRRLADLAKSRGLYLFEALTFLHAPFFRHIADTLPRLGNVRLMLCNYSKYSTRYDNYLKGIVEPVFDPALAGGTLLDLNIYNLNFALYLFGRPLGVTYAANRGYNGVDISGVVTLRYDGFVVQCAAAKDSFSPGSISIQGERGWLRVEGTPDDFRELRIHAGGTDETVSLTHDVHRMVDEFRAFVSIHGKGDYAAMERLLDHAVLVAEVAEAALADAGIHF
jgi:predicted dehydrogenase